MKHSPALLTVPLLAPALLLSETCDAQTLPSFWDRDVDWVVQPDSHHGTTQGNPSPDGEGNLVWHYEYTTTGGGLGTQNPWYDEPLTPLVWDMSWYGSAGRWAVDDDFGATVTVGGASHVGQWLAYRPMTRWKNVTGLTFEVELRGSLGVSWNGDFQIAEPIDVDVVIAHRDGGTGALTVLFSATVPKPNNNTTPEKELVPFSIAPFTVGAGDELLFSHHGFKTFANGKWVNLIDHSSCIVREPIGSRYCGAVPNSVGYGGEIAAAGSPDITDDDFALKALQLPFNEFGMFLAAQSQGFVANPGGSAGNLCLGGGIGRFNAPGQVFATATNGSGALDVDLGALPTPQGPVSAQPGESWFFQCWYRDGSTSNFTEAIRVTFL